MRRRKGRNVTERTYAHREGQHSKQQQYMRRTDRGQGISGVLGEWQRSQSPHVGKSKGGMKSEYTEKRGSQCLLRATSNRHYFYSFHSPQSKRKVVNTNKAMSHHSKSLELA